MGQQCLLVRDVGRIPGTCPTTGLFSHGAIRTTPCDDADCPWRPGARCPRDRPVLHLRAWAWIRARVREGRWKPIGGPPVGYSGRAYTIMARPNPLRGELGDGRCDDLAPKGSEVALMRALVRGRREGTVDPEAMELYRSALSTRWSGLDLSPGALGVAGVGHVQHGDALACACSANEALAGRCHRAMAAPWLVRAGWRVFLDGAEVVVSG